MKDLVEISNELNFSEKSGGDWGIINTNPNRVQEFVEYLKINTMSVSDKHEFLSLIISSFNEAILENKSSLELTQKVVELIKENLDEELYLIEYFYWASLDQEEFPVSQIIDTVLTDAGIHNIPGYFNP